MTDATQAYADQAIARGSQSFAAASRLFDEATRRDVAKLYAWCRYCDDVVDGQVLGHGQSAGVGDPQERLTALRRSTSAALSGETSDHPAFAALAEVAHRYGIVPALPAAHLDGFQADAEGKCYQTLDDLLGYCYGVAGVVGIMMAQIMGVRDPLVLDRACDLGLAFQLTNIARDIVEDAENDRVYLPLSWLAEEGIASETMAAPQHRAGLARLAERLVAAAEPFYASAQQGLPALPLRAAWAIATALLVYRAIGLKVVAKREAAWDIRVRTTKRDKIGFTARGAAMAVGSRRGGGTSPRSPDLWQRPLI
ncbi:phytoene/squalene synthase family protein [Tianweitania sediminis]|uniref:Phytoene/squalene synthase family protein n=1 Tax=Tianweitania sediminis TaxID=1502156 RepID=A0A8J7R076_9HYPH|nr:phytoene/squalene synthase family protein [Tianweitania sediminis]MBP0437605.1 phytoene/squalene synthase family protein [Tianweitania sediminis]